MFVMEVPAKTTLTALLFTFQRKLPIMDRMQAPLPTPSSPLSLRRTWLLMGAAAVLAGCSSTSRLPSTARRGGATSSVGKAPAADALQLHGELREALLARTMLVVNTPYTYGGNSPEGGFDCSGLIQWAVQGIHDGRLPRTTSQWAQFSAPVQGRGLQRGDFVFFNTLGGRYSHMGIFVGNGQFVHAPSKGGTVQRVRMDNVYFAKRFTEARSIFA